MLGIMNRENQPLATDELVEFEELLVELQDFRKTTYHFRGIQRMYLKTNTEKTEGCQHVTGWTWKH